MRSIALVVLAFAIFSLASCANKNLGDVPNMNCIPTVSWVVFDLTDAASPTDYNITTDESKNQSITFNICSYTKDKCHDFSNYAMLRSVDQEGNITECVSLTNNATTIGFNYSLLNSSEPQDGIAVTFGHGDNVTAETSYFFTLNIRCSNDSTLTVENATNDGFNYTVNAKGQMGCPKVNPSAIWQFFTSHKWIFVPVCLILGALLTFVGFRLSKFTFFTIGFAVSFLPIIYIFFAFAVNPSTPEGAKWAVLAISAIIGVLFGIISVRLEKVGYFLIGFGLAYAVSIFIFAAFLTGVSHANYIFWGMWLVLGIIIGLLMAQFKDPILILTTSILGAWLMVRPLFQLFADLPSEFEIEKEIEIGQLDKIPVLIYVYLGVWLLVTALGMYVQIVKKKEMDKEREAPPDYLAI